jgi:hypothetical protein
MHLTYQCMRCLATEHWHRSFESKCFPCLLLFCINWELPVKKGKGTWFHYNLQVTLGVLCRSRCLTPMAVINQQKEHLLVKVSAPVVHLCWLRAVTEHEIQRGGWHRASLGLGIYVRVWWFIGHFLRNTANAFGCKAKWFSYGDSSFRRMRRCKNYTSRCSQLNLYN